MDRRREVDIVEVPAVALVNVEDLGGRPGRGDALVQRDGTRLARHGRFLSSQQ
jgi:hypothetical protein